MLVRDWMSNEPFVVSAKTPIEEAIKMMRENRIRHLPVVKRDGTLTGIVTQSDLLEASPSPATSLSVWEVNFLLSKMQVKDVMKKEVIVVSEDCPLEEAALAMAEHKIGCLPVVRGRQLVGIITETDLFEIFTEQLGARRSGVRLTILIEDRKGELSRIAGRIAELGGNIIRLTSVPSDEEARQIVTLKVEDVLQEDLVRGLSQVVVKVLDARQGKGWGTEGFSPYHWTLRD